MGNLKNEVNKELNKRLDVVMEEYIFPEIQKIIVQDIDKNYYEMYEPIFYKRKFRLNKKNNWVLGKKNGKYEIYLDESIKGKWAGKSYYLIELITLGRVKRIEQGKVTHRPIPIIPIVARNLKQNKALKDIFKKYGLEIQ